MYAGFKLFPRGEYKSPWQFHRIRPVLSNCIYRRFWQPLHVRVWNVVARGLLDSSPIKQALLNLPQDSD